MLSIVWICFGVGLVIFLLVEAFFVLVVGYGLPFTFFMACDNVKSLIMKLFRRVKRKQKIEKVEPKTIQKTILEWIGENGQTKQNEVGILSSEGLKTSETITVCENCGRELTKEEEELFGNLCSDCYEEYQQEDEGD